MERMTRAEPKRMTVRVSRSRTLRGLPWRLLSILVVATFVSWPALDSGWYGDDAAFSALPAQLRATHTSLAQAIAAANALWIDANGRFYPVAIAEKYVVFDLFTNLVAYKAFLLVSTLATLAAFYALVRRFVNDGFAALAILATVACLQERAYHDSVLAYNGMMQLVALALFAGLGLVARARGASARPAIACAVALHALACATYEIAYLFFPLYGAAVWIVTADARLALRRMLPFGVTSVAFVVVSMVLRARSALTADSAYRAHLDPPLVALAFVRETLAAVPLTYFGFNVQRVFPPFTLLASHEHDVALSLGIALLTAVVAAFLFSRYRGDAPVATRAIALFGALLAVVPGILPAFSPKYQHELDWGIGYLPVFLACFGMGTLLAIAMDRALVRAGRMRSAVTVGLVVAVSAVLTLQHTANVTVVAAIDDVKSSRERLQTPLASGSIASLADGARIALVLQPSWACYRPRCPDAIDMSYLFSAYAHKRIDLVGDPRAASAILHLDATFAPGGITLTRENRATPAPHR